MNTPMAPVVGRPGGGGPGFTRLSKILACFIVGGSLIGMVASSSLDVLVLIPAKTIPYAWTLITAGFVEQYMLGLIVNVVALLFIGRTLEPIWGSKEFLKFIIVVNFLVSTITFVVMITLYSVTLDSAFLYSKISGFHGVIAGFLVAIKQLLPEQEVTALFFLRFRAKWVPSLFVLFSVVMAIVAGEGVLYLPYITLGTYTAWLYLRFFQRKAEANLKGDPSEEFGFATFFPEFCRPVVRTVATLFARLFCFRRQRAASDDDSAAVLNSKPLPGSDPIEATRRRERGARALEERLAAATSKVADSSEPSEGKLAAAGSTPLPVSTKPTEVPEAIP
eukprot:TRINITY_DN2214_c0_g2_i1.p1 TRINITY_DN2214_c0_g2~~TRINITY_DN2214_c0_g2_i1.p1  ORF type:complete len:335 (-),score=59.00 TRINITY_DN2214_c0_g2_i1:148-1152(-)